MRRTPLVIVVAAACLVGRELPAQGVVTFQQRDSSLAITIDKKPFATFVWRDPQVLRPYFAHLHAPGGIQVTRNYPPIEGQDATDHPTFHPGLWLAFGDISGFDFWRNKAAVEHVEFVEKPTTSANEPRFSVRNRYVADDKMICEEVCHFKIVSETHSTTIAWESQFSGPDDFYFGDQEEMGLGVRVATPITVKNGGAIVNKDGLKDEKQVWGKQADWCGYAGKIDGEEAGIVIVPDPRNFRRSWFHARDYGVLVANPFGQKAFTKGQASKVVVRKGETLKLRFDVIVFSGVAELKAVVDERSRGRSGR